MSFLLSWQSLLFLIEYSTINTKFQYFNNNITLLLTFLVSLYCYCFRKLMFIRVDIVLLFKNKYTTTNTGITNNFIVDIWWISYGFLCYLYIYYKYDAKQNWISKPVALLIMFFALVIVIIITYYYFLNQIK